MKGLLPVVDGLHGAFHLSNGSDEALNLIVPDGARAQMAEEKIDGRTIVAALVGQPRWEDAELEERARSAGPAQALLAGYRRYDRQTLQYLREPYFAIVADPAEGRLLMAIDRLGVQSAYFAQAGDLLIFGERADVVADHPDLQAGISPQGLFNYLYFHVVPGPGSIFEGVSRLLPGQCLIADGNGIRVDTYWQAHYDDSAGVQSEAALEKTFLATIEQAMQDRVERSEHPLGAFLSGGTDSSTVAGMLSRIAPEEARTYSIGFDAEGYDEMEYARIAARHFGTEHHEYYVTPRDVTEAVPEVAAQMDQPFGNASVVPAFFCARMAREDGVNTLFAGDGGDELFGGNSRYVKQKVFEAYERVPGVLRRALLEPLLLGVPGTDRLPVVRKARRYVEQARLPMPDRMEGYNLLLRLGADRILQSGWLEGVDPTQPLAWIRESYNGADADNLVNRMLAVDMRFTMADSDLPKVNHACRLAGVEVTYPWLDQHLVDFAAALPERHKVRGRKLRYLFKRALREFLPQEILAKRKQGFGLPFGVWMRDDQGLHALAGDSLRSLVERGILQAGAVDELLGERHQEHAAYYGTFVWVLMMLEQWLAGHDRRGAWTS